MHLLLPFSVLLLGATLSSSHPTQTVQKTDINEELRVLKEELSDIKEYIKKVENDFLTVHKARSFSSGSETLYVTNEKQGDVRTISGICTQAGGYIPNPETEAENKALQNVLKRHNKSAFIISDNSVGYTNWAPGQPNNADGTKMCVEADKDGKWHVTSCNQQLLAVCEFSFVKSREDKGQVLIKA
uniref:C-type lectin domain-containing protein n=1 Tax=Salvator merianae TaxID=96440 RepID=A0A8D0BP86_SALMN